MSTQSTLDTLATYLRAALPACAVYTEPQEVPYGGPYPALIVTEWQDYLERVYAGPGQRGNTDERPNLYSMVYLQAPATTQGVDVPAVVRALRADVEAIKAAWSKKSAQNLVVGGQETVIAAGEYMEWVNDRQGPFISYLGTNYIGRLGLLSVKEALRADVNDL